MKNTILFILLITTLSATAQSNNRLTEVNAIATEGGTVINNTADSTTFATQYRVDTLSAGVYSAIASNDTDSTVFATQYRVDTLSAGVYSAIASNDTDSTVFATQYRVDTLSAGVYSAIASNDTDSTVFATQYRVDTLSAGVYSAIASNETDSTVFATQYRVDTLSAGVYDAINQISIVDTDNQTIDSLALVGTTLQISLEDDGEAPVTVDLSSLTTANAQEVSLLGYFNPYNPSLTNGFSLYPFPLPSGSWEIVGLRYILSTNNGRAFTIDLNSHTNVAITGTTATFNTTDTEKTIIIGTPINLSAYTQLKLRTTYTSGATDPVGCVVNILLRRI